MPYNWTRRRPIGEIPTVVTLRAAGPAEADDDASWRWTFRTPSGEGAHPFVTIDEVTRYHELALSEASRALDEQRSTIDTLQSRAGVLLSFAAIANLLVGQRAFANDLNGLSQVLAASGVVAAVGAASLLLSICWGSSYHFHLEPAALAHRQGVWAAVDENSLDGYAALAMANHIATNNEGLRDLYSRLRWSLVLLVTNLSSWGFVILLEEVK